MNESSVSSKFQTQLRQALPGCVVIKHADKSMIGMVDASVTYNKKTVWMEYKFIKPSTKGVNWREFMKTGDWSPLAVAAASETQFQMAKKLTEVGNFCYLFWVLDHEALRQRVREVMMWNPITGEEAVFANTDGVVKYLVECLTGNHDVLPLTMDDVLA